MTPHTLLFVGPPGAGKGTQAEHVAAWTGWAHIDVGSLLRDRARREDALADQIKDTMASGAMLSDEVVTKILEEELDRVAQQGCLLDGYGRQKTQVEQILAWEHEKRIPPLLTVEIAAPEEELAERVKLRRYCADCHDKSYLVTDSEEAISCVRCGGHLQKRADDSQEILHKRLALYHQQTVPAINLLKERSAVITVNGLGTIEEVAHRVKEALQSHGLA